jgi:hypothetical protein
VLKGITAAFGPEIWQNTVLGFTRASAGAAPIGLDFLDYAQGRASELRKAIAEVRACVCTRGLGRVGKGAALLLCTSIAATL